MWTPVKKLDAGRQDRRNGGPALDAHPRLREGRWGQRTEGSCRRPLAVTGRRREAAKAPGPQAPPPLRVLIGAAAEGWARASRGGASAAPAQHAAPRAGGWAERAPRAGAGERGEGAERAAKPARARLGVEGGGLRASTATASGGGGGGDGGAEVPAETGGPGGGGGGPRSRSRWSGRGGSVRRSRRAGRGKKCPEGRGCRPATGMSFTIGE